MARRDTLRFLVIDDNADLGTTYRILLERRGDTATVVTTGRAGLAVAAAVPFDVVLCDIGLPDVGGLQVARQLRAQPETKELTLVAVSGFIQERDRQQALDAGFDAYLAKPMALADLDAVLAKLGAPARRP